MAPCEEGRREEGSGLLRFNDDAHGRSAQTNKPSWVCAFSTWSRPNQRLLFLLGLDKYRRALCCGIAPKLAPLSQSALCGFTELLLAWGWASAPPPPHPPTPQTHFGQEVLHQNESWTRCSGKNTRFSLSADRRSQTGQPFQTKAQHTLSISLQNSIFIRLWIKSVLICNTSPIRLILDIYFQ